MLNNPYANTYVFRILEAPFAIKQFCEIQKHRMTHLVWPSCSSSLGILVFLYYQCFVHPIFSSFGFWYFGHFSCVIFFPFFFCLAHLALQNVNKDYITFSYFRNFVPKSDQKPKTKNGMNETIMTLFLTIYLLPFLRQCPAVSILFLPIMLPPQTCFPLNSLKVR